MSRTVTLTDLILYVRQRANMENSSFVTDAEITARLNGSIAELQGLLIRVNGDEYFETQSTITTISGSQTYSLPSDFFKLTGVFWNANTGELLRMRRYNPVDSERQITGQGWSYNWPIFYRINAENIRFVPIPAAAHTVTLKYIQAPGYLSSGSDTFDGYGGWEEWVIWDTVATLLAKEESDASFAMGMRDREEARILIMADRDQADPQRVQDTISADPGWWYGGGGWR